MKRLSDYKNEEALEILADLLDPVVAIMGNPEFAAAFRARKPKTEIIKIALKKNAKDIIKVLAILDNEDPATYECSLVSVPAKVLQIMNDPELVSFFTQQVEKTEDESSTLV